MSPPLLGSKIRNDMLRAFLAPEPADLVVDLGCGSGRALLWNRDWGAPTVGIDISPFFSAEARREVDLLIGDLRRLPFADGTFTKAFSLDVLEHLSPEALRGMLAEAARVLAPGGALFVYTHVRKNAPIAVGLRVDQRARAAARAHGAHRHAAGTPAQVRSPEPARATSRSSSRSPRDAGFRIDAHPLLHADRRRVRREHPDADGRARDGAPRGRPSRPARSAPAEADAQAIREARTAAKAQHREQPDDLRGAARRCRSR